MLLLFLAAAGAIPPLPPQPKAFGDWEVGCDNHRDCEAVGFQEPYDPDSEIPFIGIITDRRADPLAQPKVYMDTRFFELDDYTGDVVADGKRTGLTWNKKADLVGDPDDFARLLATSKSLSLVDSKGKTLGRFRTSGASAALRWMDEGQQRTGTVTAIVAKGAKPASAVPSPPALPTIRVPANSSAPPGRLKAAQIAAIRKRFDMCEEPRGDTDYYRIDAANSVAIVNCWNGPYQSDGIIVLIPDKGQYGLAPIDQPTAEERKAPVAERSRLISPGYDPERRLLYMEYRGRGLNDCGANASWAWDGTAFRLASYRALDECRGVTGRLPYWQTSNDPAASDE
jgi:hypothetical protein